MGTGRPEAYVRTTWQLRDAVTVFSATDNAIRDAATGIRPWQIVGAGDCSVSGNSWVDHTEGVGWAWSRAPAELSEIRCDGTTSFSAANALVSSGGGDRVFLDAGDIVVDQAEMVLFPHDALEPDSIVTLTALAQGVAVLLGTAEVL
jgi:hypothetical protein